MVEAGDKPSDSMGEVIAQTENAPEAELAAQKKHFERPNDNIDALLVGGGEAEAPPPQKRHFAEVPTTEASEVPQKRHYEEATLPTLEAGAGGLGSVTEEVRKSSLHLVPREADSGNLVAHEVDPTDLSAADKSGKRVFDGYSGGVETEEQVKAQPKRSKHRRATTVGASIYPGKSKPTPQVVRHNKRVFDGVANQQDRVLQSTSATTSFSSSSKKADDVKTRRHFKDVNQDHLNDILKQNKQDGKKNSNNAPKTTTQTDHSSVAGRTSVEINSTRPTTSASGTKATAMSGNAMKNILSWGN